MRSNPFGGRLLPPSGAPPPITIKGEDGLWRLLRQRDDRAVVKGPAQTRRTARAGGHPGLVGSPSLVLPLRGLGTLPSGGFCGAEVMLRNRTRLRQLWDPLVPHDPHEWRIHDPPRRGDRAHGCPSAVGDRHGFGCWIHVSGRRREGAGADRFQSGHPLRLTTVTTYTSNKSAMSPAWRRASRPPAPRWQRLFTRTRYIAQLPRHSPRATSSVRVFRLWSPFPSRPDGRGVRSCRKGHAGASETCLPGLL